MRVRNRIFLIAFEMNGNPITMSLSFFFSFFIFFRLGDLGE